MIRNFLVNFDLNSSYVFDQVLLDETEKIIFINFRKINKIPNISIYKIFENFKKNFIFFSIDREKIFDFDKMYEFFFLSEHIFFFKNKRILIDLGTGNNNKIKNLRFDKKKIYIWFQKIFLGIKKGKNIIFLP